MIITINFSNDVKKYYLCNLKLKDNRLINTSYVYGYNLKKTITNNFSEASYNSDEQFALLSKKDIKEYNTAVESPKSTISFTNLKNISLDLEEASTDADETFVISKDSNILTDTKVTISTQQHYNNEFHFFVQSSVKGQILLSASNGVLNKSQIISNGPITYYGAHVTNNSFETINVTIKADFIPDQPNKYKSSSTSLQTTIAGKEQTNQVNNTIVNAVTTSNNSNSNSIANVIQMITNNNSTSNKKPTNSSIIYNNGNIVEWNSVKGKFGC